MIAGEPLKAGQFMQMDWKRMQRRLKRGLRKAFGAELAKLVGFHPLT